MRFSTVFEVPVPPDRVAAYLAEPRHLIDVNHNGPVLESSDGPTVTGSWYILGFDQLRARIEYTTFDPPAMICAHVGLTGKGSGGMAGLYEFRLSDVGGGRGTRVEASAEGSGGLIRWAPLQRAALNMRWRRMRQQM